MWNYKVDEESKDIPDNIDDIDSLCKMMKVHFDSLGKDSELYNIIDKWIKMAQLVSLPLARKLENGFFYSYSRKDTSSKKDNWRESGDMLHFVEEYGGYFRTYLQMYPMLRENISVKECLSDILEKTLNTESNYITQFQEKILDDPPAKRVYVDIIEDLYTTKSDNPTENANIRAENNKSNVREASKIYENFIEKIYYDEARIIIKNNAVAFTNIMKMFLGFGVTIFRFYNNKFKLYNLTDCVYQYEDEELIRLYYVETVSCYDEKEKLKVIYYIHSFEKDEDKESKTNNQYLYIVFKCEENKIELEKRNIVHCSIIDNIPIQVKKEDYSVGYAIDKAVGQYFNVLNEIKVTTQFEEAVGKSLNPAVIMDGAQANLKEPITYLSGGRDKMGRMTREGALSTPVRNPAIPGVPPRPFLEIIRPYGQDAIQMFNTIYALREQQSRMSFLGEEIAGFFNKSGMLTNQNARIMLDMISSISGNKLKSSINITQSSINQVMKESITERFKKINKVKTDSLDTAEGINDYLYNLFYYLDAGEFLQSEKYQVIGRTKVSRDFYFILAALYVWLTDDKTSEEIEKKFLNADYIIKLTDLSKICKAFKKIGKQITISMEERISLQINASTSFEALRDKIFEPLILMGQTVGQFNPTYITTITNFDKITKSLRLTSLNEIMNSDEEIAEIVNQMNEAAANQQAIDQAEQVGGLQAMKGLSNMNQ
jgi:hypothetical protein